ncbi:hypothetical protein RF11_08170 [Thelohanellus kitauei]|uniref:Uncharacterized protein n=1 Tax=Thelohanellus kitauei TaxID=669202 RepID=A0A0C2N9G9_THEKT|nr:hypothetical protein RF11_08170 [Thelohanellus kitauei]
MAMRILKAEQVSQICGIFKFDNYDDKTEPWAIMHGLDIEGNELDVLKTDLYVANVGSIHFKYMSENLKGVFTWENGYESIIDDNNLEKETEEEWITDFVSVLKDLAVNRHFGNLTEERLRDQFVLKLNEQHIKQEMIRKFYLNKASLQEVVDEAILVSSSTTTATEIGKREHRIS